ncbi:MAG: polysulfide reductase NrfD [Candidatus Eremiobacteraeota bacterium]|nr:polysulfide reductase NrfD [Candidatus Eremiobacteraeota bacterium]
MSQGLERAAHPDDAFGGAQSRDGDLEPNISYFGQPLLKRPQWGWNVITYLFLGGVMGGCGILAALADPQRSDGDRKLARNAKYLSLALATACPALLISHLGRPERFLNMLRIVKFKSPMSLGVWGLVAFSNVAALNAFMELIGKRSRALNIPQALLGGFIAGYSGVLLSATAIPLWAKGKYHIPAISVCSGVAGACALNAMMLAFENAPQASSSLERLERISALAESSLIRHFNSYADFYGKPLFEGARGMRFRTCTLLVGIALPTLLNRLPLCKGSAKTLLSGALTLFGGYILRESLMEAGKDSADDPKAAFSQPT